MSNQQEALTLEDDGLVLRGLDGTNPLGFLAALGVLNLINNRGKKCQRVLMSWSNTAGTWKPMLHGVESDGKKIAGALAARVKCPFRVGQDADLNRREAQKVFDEKKTQLKKAVQNFKKRGLRGNERKEAEDKELGPIRYELESLRAKWLKQLCCCVPSAELSLGKHLNATCSELRKHFMSAVTEASLQDRDVPDLYAAFGSDVCHKKRSNQMQATRFCFTKGTGHQYFLDTVRQLYESVTSGRIEEAIFTSCDPKDEKLSMRWDPQEDRRYALMWDDPSPSSNKPKTNWALNLLAYRGLPLLPSIPQTKGLSTTGWETDERPAWTWPIWRGKLEIDVVRSVLAQPIFTGRTVDQEKLKLSGIVGLYQSECLEIGEYVNFAPSRQIA